MIKQEREFRNVPQKNFLVYFDVLWTKECKEVVEATSTYLKLKNRYKKFLI